jgi:uncharacterized protein YcbK (DUF882 family)
VLRAFVLVLAASLASAEEPAMSKKERFLVEKEQRKPVRRAAAPKPGSDAPKPISLVNLWTQEVLPVDPARAPAEPEVDRFLRCHDTNQATTMDPRLLDVLVAAARRFKTGVIEIVSAYRAPKYQLMLRKKGHEVARDSQHPLGHAVDFRLPGLPTRALLRFVRSLRRGGVGYYPDSAFVHADTGPIRFWRGH